MSDALADVLARLIGAPVGRLVSIDGRGVNRMAPPSKACSLVPWTHDTLAEAVEALHACGLWPWLPGDDGAPAWWCSCDYGGPGRGSYTDCLTCDDHGHTSAPPSRAALVSVARLGAETLRAIEELTRVLRDHAGCAGARLVWRVMTRAEIRDHHERISLLSYAHAGDLATMPMSDLLCVAASRSAWSEEPSDGPPALRDLHRLGVHLIAIDERRVVLAVEEIGGGRE